MGVFQRIRWACLLPFLLGAVVVLGATIANAGVAEFQRVSGVVDIFHAGERKSTPAAKGISVVIGDTVRTGRRSRAKLKFADGSVLNIGSLTKINIGEFSFNADTKVRKTSISNLRGKVRAAVSKSSENDSYYRIKTPGAVAAVRGTVLRVEYHGGKTTLTTFEGKVAFGASVKAINAGAGVMVRAGQISFMPKGLKVPTPPVVATPAQLGAMSAATESQTKSSAVGSSTDSGADSGTDSGADSGADSGVDSTDNSGSSSADSGSSTSSSISSTTTETSASTTTSGISTTSITTTTTNAGSSSISSTTSTSSVVPTATAVPTATPVPTATAVPTATPVPTATAVSTIAVPTATLTPPVVVVPVTPPITITTPAVAKKATVNLVIQF